MKYVFIVVFSALLSVQLLASDNSCSGQRCMPLEQDSTYSPNKDSVILDINDRLTSSNRQFYLTYLSDGNLVLFTMFDTDLWSSGTLGNTPGKVYLTKGGNLIIRNALERIVWQSGTEGKCYAGSKLILTDEGELQLINLNGIIVWRTKTGMNKPNKDHRPKPKSCIENKRKKG
jgi:hypothetical protein